MAPARNIILTGFMGVGKSSVGKRLAARLGWEFVDTDALIEHEAGMPISQIFAQSGEAAFRTREQEVIGRVSLKEGCVIAVGGGAIVDARNAQCLRASGTVVCLTARPEVICERLRGNPDRPLLQGANPLEKIQALHAARAEAYARADVAIDTSFLDVDAVVEAVLAAVR